MPHFLMQFAVHGGFGILAVLDQAGGQFHQHGIDARGERRKAKLLDQDDGVGDRVVRHERDGAAAAPEFPGARLATSRRRSGDGGTGSGRPRNGRSRRVAGRR